MFYETSSNAHGLRHDPFKAIAVPRPIGWISTVSKTGVCNLAPYSFFNAVSEKPHYVVIGAAGFKDTPANIAETGEFVCSMATYDLRENMNMTSAPVPADVDEFPLGQLTAAKSTLVKPPRVKESPAAFECVHWQTLQLPDGAGVPSSNYLIIGRIVGIYIDDRIIKDGMVDTGGMRPISRMGYMDYAVVTPETMFTMTRPSADQALAKTKG